MDNCAELVDNYEWLGKLSLIEFLRKIGSKFSVNKMLALESTRQRLSRQQNLSFLEFNYSIFQAYDFTVLNQKYNCMIQFGGSDQWGNIISGIDLVKKEINQQVYGLTTPLITTSSGKKMGKTADGAVWLSADKYSINKFWQYWRNTSDDDVIRFLKLFTEIDLERIHKYKKLKGEELNEIKILLANEVTKLCHGAANSQQAENEAKSFLSSSNLESQIIDSCKQRVFLKEVLLEKGISVKKILIDLNLTESNAQSKRLIEQGAIKINENIVRAKDQLIMKKDFKKNHSKEGQLYLVIYVGKKKYGLVQLVT